MVLDGFSKVTEHPQPPYSGSICQIVFYVVSVNKMYAPPYFPTYFWPTFSELVYISKTDIRINKSPVQ